MRLLRLLAEWFWRMDTFLGGDSSPEDSQRFSAAHPVRLGLVVGLAFGGLLGAIVLISALAGAEHALTLTSLAICVGGAAIIGLVFVGVGYFERRRQRHYGHYPPETHARPDNRP